MPPGPVDVRIVAQEVAVRRVVYPLRVFARLQLRQQCAGLGLLEAPDQSVALGKIPFSVDVVAAELDLELLVGEPGGQLVALQLR
ncbi:hypothetical protein D3C71_1975630 [compost metagenome]